MPSLTAASMTSFLLLSISTYVPSMNGTFPATTVTSSSTPAAITPFYGMNNLSVPVQYGTLGTVATHRVVISGAASGSISWSSAPIVDNTKTTDLTITETVATTTGGSSNAIPSSMTWTPSTSSVDIMTTSAAAESTLVSSATYSVATSGAANSSTTWTSTSNVENTATTDLRITETTVTTTGGTSNAINSSMIRTSSTPNVDFTTSFVAAVTATYPGSVVRTLELTTVGTVSTETLATTSANRSATFAESTVGVSTKTSSSHNSSMSSTSLALSSSSSSVFAVTTSSSQYSSMSSTTAASSSVPSPVLEPTATVVVVCDCHDGSIKYAAPTGPVKVFGVADRIAIGLAVANDGHEYHVDAENGMIEVCNVSPGAGKDDCARMPIGNGTFSPPAAMQARSTSLVAREDCKNRKKELATALGAGLGIGLPSAGGLGWLLHGAVHSVKFGSILKGFHYKPIGTTIHLNLPGVHFPHGIKPPGIPSPPKFPLPKLPRPVNPIHPPTGGSPPLPIHPPQPPSGGQAPPRPITPPANPPQKPPTPPSHPLPNPPGGETIPEPPIGGVSPPGGGQVPQPPGGGGSPPTPQQPPTPPAHPEPGVEGPGGNGPPQHVPGTGSPVQPPNPAPVPENPSNGGPENGGNTADPPTVPAVPGPQTPPKVPTPNPIEPPQQPPKKDKGKKPSKPPKVDPGPGPKQPPKKPSPPQNNPSKPSGKPGSEPSGEPIAGTQPVNPPSEDLTVLDEPMLRETVRDGVRRELDRELLKRVKEAGAFDFRNMDITQEVEQRLSEEVLEPETKYIVSEAVKGVIEEGTGSTFDALEDAARKGMNTPVEEAVKAFDAGASAAEGAGATEGEAIDAGIKAAQDTTQEMKKYSESDVNNLNELLEDGKSGEQLIRDTARLTDEGTWNSISNDPGAQDAVKADIDDQLKQIEQLDHGNLPEKLKDADTKPSRYGDEPAEARQKTAKEKYQDAAKDAAQNARKPLRPPPPNAPPGWANTMQNPDFAEQLHPHWYEYPKNFDYKEAAKQWRKEGKAVEMSNGIKSRACNKIATELQLQGQMRERWDGWLLKVQGVHPENSYPPSLDTMKQVAEELAKKPAAKGGQPVDVTMKGLNEIFRYKGSAGYHLPDAAPPTSAPGTPA